MPRKHIVITGTGRTGTTFLVQLFTSLGLDTGYSPEDLDSPHYNPNARAGLEHDIRLPQAPYVVKSPWFCDYAGEVLADPDIIIEHVFVPMRSIFAAAESRRFVLRQAKEQGVISANANPESVPGGLWHTQSDEQGIQERILLDQFYKLMLALSGSMVPVTLLQYPRLVAEPRYLYEKLRPVSGSIDFAAFKAAYDKTANPAMVHRFGEEDH